MSKNEVLMSIIVPVYNAEQYIEECVKSILKQNYLVKEIILVDDGSTDRSGIICDLLSKKDECVKVLHTENQGIIRARLNGVKASRGKWITFIDADDWISEDAYKDIIPANGCDIMITGICRYIDEEHQIMQIPYFEEGIYKKEDILKEILPVMLWTPILGDWALDPSLCTKIFKRNMILEYLERASEVKSTYGEDSAVIFPMMLQAKCVQISGKIYYYHRQRPEDAIQPYIQDEEFILKLYEVYTYLMKQFKQTEYWSIMKRQLDCFYINGIEIKKRCYEYPDLEFLAYFPVTQVPKGSKVVLYGAGEVGKQYWKQNSEYHFCDIILWVDKEYKNRQADNYEIENPEIVKQVEFDYIIIAVDDYYIAKEIAIYLNGFGIKDEKYVWHSVRVDQRRFEKCNKYGDGKKEV